MIKRALIILSVGASPHLAQAQPVPVPVEIQDMVAWSESRAKPCATNITRLKYDRGQLSIGAYQMSSRYGNAQSMLNWMAIDMTGLDPKRHASAYAARFEAICERNPDYFLSQQTEYLLHQWPEWQRALRRYEALERAPKALKALTLSVVVSLGYEGSKPILEPLRVLLPRKTVLDLIYDISNKRACYWKSRGGANVKGWMVRADREYRQALIMMGEAQRGLKVVCGE